MMPVDPMAYLPNFFFGALVMWIGQDILKASECGHPLKLARPEYVCVHVWDACA